jgi:Ca2+-binding RTX toxin-like protein
MQNDTELTVLVPIPDEAEPAAGSDAQVVIVNSDTGGEWGAWQFRRTEDGSYEAGNGYHYNTTWDAVPPPSTGGGSFVSRGAGLPYLAGLVRPCEIEEGRIEHALAYDSPSGEYVYPATKSDGNDDVATAIPEGARLQLDPEFSEDDLAGFGCTDACLTVARAVQEYGMIVVDNSGRPKVMFEYEGTANGQSTVTESTMPPIELKHFRVLDTRTVPSAAGCTVSGTESDDVLLGTRSAGVICGFGGNDEIQALEGNDVIYGGDGDDTILGGNGRDSINAGAGSDIVTGGTGSDVIDGAPGQDTLVGGPGNDLLLARDDEVDTVDGGPGSNEAELDADDAGSNVEER